MGNGESFIDILKKIRFLQEIGFLKVTLHSDQPEELGRVSVRHWVPTPERWNQKN